MRKISIIIVLMILAATAVGCSTVKKQDPSPPLDSPAADIETNTPTKESVEPPTDEPEEREPAESEYINISSLVYKIGEDSNSPGRLVFKGRYDYLLLLDKNNEYTSSEEDDIPFCSFSFPAEWEFDGSSIFYNGERKVLEVSAVIELLPGADIASLLNHIQYSDGGFRQISEEAFSFNDLTGFKRVDTGSLIDNTTEKLGEDRTYYIHRYIVSDGKYALMMSFWETDETLEENELLFNELVRTLEFSLQL